MSNEDDIFDQIGHFKHENPETFLIVKYPFEKYLVSIKTDVEGKFLGITEIEINQDFINYEKLKIKSSEVNIEQFYFNPEDNDDDH
ncbi:hypothetical protein DSAG12_01451 [Promethearchaeum syntrophicum]|uniref:Uncharacterized protein n=1 Tax=Promethearchaeum syntrophicum TaxID=2594042 RepID=A0A5B9D9J1_9ARCH|nr:hypothetical protein [Candidatus Prometheoarchaeum syntrophicum]QEE15625.1 hypothetical protein DSAG12_01451 [Candidatus Prometheoarchaeum syntrophicum]